MDWVCIWWRHRPCPCTSMAMPGSPKMLYNPRYLSYNAPWHVSPMTQALAKGFDWLFLCLSLIGSWLVIPCKYDIKGGPSAPFEAINHPTPFSVHISVTKFDKQCHSNFSHCDLPVQPAIWLRLLLFLKVLYQPCVTTDFYRVRLFVNSLTRRIFRVIRYMYM